MNYVIDKPAVEVLKHDREQFYDLVHSNKDSAIIYALKHLGKLDNDDIVDPLTELLNHHNATVREYAIKNLAKYKKISLLPLFIQHATDDSGSDVRRESVSAIGRLRNEQTIPTLIDLLSDRDPKIVMQAIRGLLVFPNHQKAMQQLHKLIDHPNELIREVIHKHFNDSGSSTTSTHNAIKHSAHLQNLVVHGDSMRILQAIPDESIHLTFTSPPYYNARDYSIYQSYEQYLHFLEVIFRQVHRVTHEGRFFILNTSPVIIPRVSRAHSSKRYPIPYDIHHRLVNMGWEFIDDIIWVKPEASVKNRNAGFLQHRKPLAYKPNAITEQIMVYRKKTDKLIDWNIRHYDTETVEVSKVNEQYETTNVWHIDPTFDKVHSAVFPTELCNRIIKYYSFVGDLVFDPFAGSGTLGKAALALRRHFLLTEQHKHYCDRIISSLDGVDKQDEAVRYMSFEQFATMR